MNEKALASAAAAVLAVLLAAPVSGAPHPPTPPTPPAAPAPPAPPDGPFVWEWDGWSSPRRFIGVSTLELTPELREHFGVDKELGVMVSRVEKDSPAAKAGLKAGDIILRADGRDVARTGDLRRAIQRRDGGEKIDLEITKGGRGSSRVAVEIAERKSKSYGRRFDFPFDDDKWAHEYEARMKDAESRMRDAERRLEEKMKHLEERLRERAERLRD